MNILHTFVFILKNISKDCHLVALGIELLYLPTQPRPKLSGVNPFLHSRTGLHLNDLNVLIHVSVSVHV